MAEMTRRNVKDEARITMPKMYSVILHNDDYTTMEFVVEILEKIFHKSNVEAAMLMMEVHQSGKSSVGVYTYDIACTKKIQADQAANEKGFPLKITIESCM